MISKLNRLKEREVKKVLQKGKPFFSYGIVLNKILNKSSYDKFAIVIGSKSVSNNVTRNFFRRRFYTRIREFIKQDISSKKSSYVFVVKKQMKLDKNDNKSINTFDKDLNFLINKLNIGKQKY
ncbi:hypothetical protein CSB08_00710 [Candidatus Gracilibacteria bacterium]|nr:MAG: hypothetical protein CSB08_00710 [Candidatus Gracilibacteria bacterium]PIE85750.1 MAG: hypothetical protein CSA08_00550 [Candidatus Gracilibacteria bacterium]